MKQEKKNEFAKQMECSLSIHIEKHQHCVELDRVQMKRAQTNESNREREQFYVDAEWKMLEMVTKWSQS